MLAFMWSFWRSLKCLEREKLHFFSLSKWRECLVCVYDDMSFWIFCFVPFFAACLTDVSDVSMRCSSTFLRACPLTSWCLPSSMQGTSSSSNQRIPRFPPWRGSATSWTPATVTRMSPCYLDPLKVKKKIPPHDWTRTESCGKQKDIHVQVIPCVWSAYCIMFADMRCCTTMDNLQHAPCLGIGLFSVVFVHLGWEVEMI